MSFIYEPAKTQLVIVPDLLREAINEKLDAALAAAPEAEADREVLYSHLVCFFDEYGYVPEFELARREAS